MMLLGLLPGLAGACSLDRQPGPSGVSGDVQSVGSPILGLGPLTGHTPQSTGGASTDPLGEFPLAMRDVALPPDVSPEPYVPDAGIPAVGDAGATADAGAQAPEPTDAGPNVDGAVPCTDCGSDAGFEAPPPPPAGDGERCEADADCMTGHCNAGLCCAGGACCLTEADCVTDATQVSAICTSPATCQGERGKVSCEAFRCVAKLGIPDDSGCHPSIEADNCGYYPTVSCSGAVEQSVPSCATACASDADCDANAFCDSGACVPKQPDGQQCGGDADCESDHCQNGYCCSGGDCCQTDLDCPGNLSAGAACVDVTSCSGTAVAATCSSSSTCVQTTIPANGACAGQVAQDCGRYPPLVCGTDGLTQGACPDRCMQNADCLDPFECRSGTCEKPKKGKN